MMTRQKHEKGALNTPFYAKFRFRIWTRYVISFSETTQLLPRLFVRFNDNYVRVSLWLLGFRTLRLIACISAGPCPRTPVDPNVTRRQHLLSATKTGRHG